MQYTMTPDEGRPETACLLLVGLWETASCHPENKPPKAHGDPRGSSGMPLGDREASQRCMVFLADATHRPQDFNFFWKSWGLSTASKWQPKNGQMPSEVQLVSEKFWLFWPMTSPLKRRIQNFLNCEWGFITHKHKWSSKQVWQSP